MPDGEGGAGGPQAWLRGPAAPGGHRAAGRVRRIAGFAIVAGGVAVGLHAAWLAALELDDPLRRALLGGLFAALATALGTLPALIGPVGSERARDGLLGFGAGVMLAACSFSLVVPGLAAAEALGHGRWSAGAIVGAGVLAGAALLLLLERLVPHEHFIKGREREPARAVQIKRVWLFVFAIALHNLPEGLAIGVAAAGPDAAAGAALATGIAIQDVPEGLVVTMALRGIGHPVLGAMAIGAATGLVEPLGALAGAAAVSASAMLLPWGLAVAAGAMLFVISHEIIPESHRAGHESLATSGLVVGFVGMMLLDTALG